MYEIDWAGSILTGIEFGIHRFISMITSAGAILIEMVKNNPLQGILCIAVVIAAIFIPKKRRRH